MKKWKCKICGYIHEGENPPTECPICHASKEAFAPISDDGAVDKEEYVQLAELSSTGKKRWQCKVCLYIYEGDEPPEKCPRCWAPKEEFVLLGETSSEKPDEFAPPTTDETEADVLIVGTGGAAFVAAITAKQEGCSVIMLEKAGTIGGTTKRSGGGFWTPNNRHQREAGITDTKEDAVKYMTRQSYPNLYNPDAVRYGLPQNEFDLIDTFYDHSSEMVEYLEKLGVFESTKEINWLGKMPVDYQSQLPENKLIRGRILYTKDVEGNMGFGVVLIKHFKKWAKEHHIPVQLKHEVKKILQDKSGRVTGLEVDANGESKTYKAKKAIFFGTGGYSHNEELKLHFQRGPIYGGCAAPESTGDFIKMGIEIGTKLGNMAGAFRAQSLFESVLENPIAANNAFFIAGDSVLQVNKFGRRVVDEKRNYNDRGMVHFAWDPNRAEWTNMLLFMIFDNRTMDLWQGFPPYPISGETSTLIMKANTLDELSKVIAKRLERHKAHTGNFKLDESFTTNLKETINKFNKYAKEGKDPDFQRGDYEYDLE